MRTTVLVLEPAPGAADALVARLATPGRTVTRAPTDAVRTGPVRLHPDVVLVLDDPARPGTAPLVVADVRAVAARVPLAVVGTSSDDDHRIRCYETGADDHLPLGCSDRELEARVRALLRRAPAGGPEQPVSRAARVARAPLTCGPLALDPLTREATLGGAPLRLTAREFDLLAYLLARPDHVVTRQQLLRDVWGASGHGSGRTVDVHVAQVRAKLGEHAHLVRTIRGVGYSSRSAHRSAHGGVIAE